MILEKPRSRSNVVFSSVCSAGARALCERERLRSIHSAPAPVSLILVRAWVLAWLSLLRSLSPAQPFVQGKLRLRGCLVSGSSVGLRQPIVGSGKIGPQVDGLPVFRDGLPVLSLLGVQCPKLQVPVREVRVEGKRAFEQGLDLAPTRV